MDIALLVHWKSVRYKIETPFLAALRLCVKYASRNKIEICLRRNISLRDIGGYSLRDIHGYCFTSILAISKI